MLNLLTQFGRHFTATIEAIHQQIISIVILLKQFLVVLAELTFLIEISIFNHYQLSVLEKLSDVQLVETIVPNYVEKYTGKVDLVARYEGVPCTIELTTAEEPKLRVGKLYDKPLQLVAYGGAINRCYGESLFGTKVVNGLIVVALPGEDAEIFTFKREELLNYWQEWLKRLKSFGEKAA
jgi:hypothetical protein